MHNIARTNEIVCVHEICMTYRGARYNYKTKLNHMATNGLPVKSSVNS